MTTKTRTSHATYVLLLLGLLCFCSLEATAQATTKRGDDYNKVEFYGGYSIASVQPNVKEISEFGMTFSPCSPDATPILGQNFQTSFCKRATFNGFDTSLTYNVSRYIGIKGNISGHFKSKPYTDDIAGAAETVTRKEHYINYLVGLQVKDNSRSARFKPFGHFLVGAATYNYKATNDAPTRPSDNFQITAKTTAFAMKFGGGIDVKVHKRIDLRVIEVNYNPVFIRDYSLVGDPYGAIPHTRNANNFTFGFGIVIH
ncbi:MAG: outer membrane beta-barrel protein [Pyrinomonadaceae bacterium]